MRSLFLAGLLAGFAAPALAAAITPADYAMLQWRSIGPFRGGRALAVQGAGDSPLHFYFGSVNGGVWETKDAGRTWNPIFDSAPVGSIGALAVAPSNPRTLYVGTGESDMRSDIAQGEGMWRSADGGAHWTFSGLKDTQQIARILVDPRDDRRVLVAALGHPYGPNEQRGVFLSTDGGATWTRTLFKDADTGAVDLAFEPGKPNVVYAALWRTRRPPWNVYPPASGPGGGLYKSTDGGATWTPIASAVLPASPGRIGLTVSAAAPRRLYALIDAKGAGGLFRSDDEGATWTKASGDARIWQRGWYFGEPTANPANADELWVADTIVLHSVDGGRTFLPQKGDPTGDDYHHLWIDPKDPARRILGSDQGVLVTLNGGATWSSWFNQPTGQFYHVATDNRFPYRVYGAQQDSGAANVPSRTGSWDGINITQFRETTAGGESDNIAPDPNDPDIIYGGRVDKFDLRTNQVRNVDPTLATPGEYRATWTLPLTFSADGKALYFANQRLWATRDGGERWTPIGPDLTRPAPVTPPNLDAVTAADDEHPTPRKGVIYAIGPSPRDEHEIWLGTDDGLVWRTRDGGAHWSDVTPRQLSDWSKVGVVEPSHFDAERAYIAVDRHRLDDQRPYAYRTRDGGRSWAPITAGLDQTVNVVREDPRQPGLLFAGTERGAFVSFDDGDHWSPLKSGLPATSVRDMTIHGDDLVIATHGRGFYVLDDIAPLRLLASGGTDRGTRLFPPSEAVRFRPSAFTGTPMPKDEPMAPDPAFGAVIDYSLAADAPVELRIEDEHGALVRRFRSDDPDPAPDLAKIDAAPEWMPRHPPPSAAAGVHRFVWDLRYAQPSGLGGNPQIGGVWAPPGRYTVVLMTGGATLRAPLTLVPDPRVKETTADYRRQFELARRIEDDRAALQPLLTANLGDKALKARAERLDALQTAVDGADAAPSPDAVAGYAALKAGEGATPSN